MKEYDGWAVKYPSGIVFIVIALNKEKITERWERKSFLYNLWGVSWERASELGVKIVKVKIQEVE